MDMHGDEKTPAAGTASKWQAPFFTIWTGQAFSLLGSMLVQFALIWWLTKTTGSGTVLAMASLVGLLPQIFIMPIAGALVDRWSRRWTMVIADSLVALATLVLALLFWSGLIQIWHVYLLLFFRSAVGGFHWAAMQTSTSLMVPKEHLSRIQGLNQMLNGGMNIAAAPLGALLLDLLPMQGVLAIDVATAFLAVTPLLFVAVPQPKLPAANAAGEKVSVWQDFRAGLRYVASWPGLLIIGGMATMINFLLTPAFSLQPLLVTKHFAGGAMQYAGMEALSGVGIILGGLALSVWGGFKRRIVTTMVGLIGIGIGTLALGLLPPSAFVLALALSLFLGVTSPITNGPLFAVVQDVVEPEMQGRVFTLIGAVSAAMSPIGLVIAGPLADHFGVQSWYIVGGVFTLLMGIAGFAIPAVMNIEDGRPGQSIAQVPLAASAALQPSEASD